MNRAIPPLLTLLLMTLTGCAQATPPGSAPAPDAPVAERTPDAAAAYAPTDAGVCEIKRLPPGRILEASTAGDPRDEATMNRVFMPLFRYIRAEDIAMTVPVEMRGAGAPAMAFYLGGEAAARTDLPARDPIRIRTLEPRVVASLAERGGYTAERFASMEQRLRAWLTAHPDWEPAGDAYAVFWNSPFVPNFLKKSEVHVPVRRKPAR